jgi:hypothetical protein
MDESTEVVPHPVSANTNAETATSAPRVTW